METPSAEKKETGAGGASTPTSSTLSSSTPTSSTQVAPVTVDKKKNAKSAIIAVVVIVVIVLFNVASFAISKAGANKKLQEVLDVCSKNRLAPYSSECTEIKKKYNAECNVVGDGLHCEVKYKHWIFF